MFYEKFKLDEGLVFEQKTGSCLAHKLHAHDVLELHVLKRNDAVFQLADRAYEGKPGDVFLFRPFEPHWNLMKEENKPIEWISVLFTPAVARLIPGGCKLLAPFYAAEGFPPIIPAASPHAKAIQELASLAVAEERDKRIGWESKRFLYFTDMLVHILRYAVEHHRMDANEAMEDGIWQAIEYALIHFAEDIDMDRFIEAAGKKRTYFYKNFKKLTGLSPNQFIHKLRIQAAVYLLLNSDRPVTDIAYDCGYGSVEFFDKRFRQSQGMSPRELRKSMSAPRRR